VVLNHKEKLLQEKKESIDGTEQDQTLDHTMLLGLHTLSSQLSQQLTVKTTAIAIQVVEPGPILILALIIPRHIMQLEFNGQQ